MGRIHPVSLIGKYGLVVPLTLGADLIVGSAVE